MEQPVYHLPHTVRTRAEPEDFNGPLDLILHLLRKNKMEISDIQISLILEQYLAWMRERKELDLEVASEFVVMSSQLLLIKTRMLLNLHDEEALSELDELKAQLQAQERHADYLRLRAASETLGARYARGKDYISKDPEPLEPDRTYHYVHQPADLLRGLKNALSRGEGSLPPPPGTFAPLVGKEPYPVGEKAEELERFLRRRGVVRIRTLLRTCRSRSELVAAFLAVLELCRRGKISLAGTERDCTVAVIEPESGALSELEKEA